MKRTLILCLLVLLACSVQAEERQGHTGLGFRGLLIAPMSEGAEFNIDGRQYEPFMMGWGFGLELSHGVSERFVVAGSMDYSGTYDEITEDGDQSFAFANSDNAAFKLKALHLGFTGRYFVLPASRLQPYVLAGGGMDYWWFDNQTTTSSRRVHDLALKIGAGFTYPINDRWGLDVRGVYTHDVHSVEDNVSDIVHDVKDWTDYDQRPFHGHFQPSIGLTYYFGGVKDTDKDGVKDDVDQCPETPLGALVDRNGCPLDGDGDGVYDGLDKCINTPRGARVDATGCPLDSDGDGVFDGLDQCEDTPAGAQVDAVGCPLDDDKDGVPNYRDLQLDTPLGAVVDADGVGVDSDKDGVYDGLDKCPGTPSDLQVDATGCPISVQRLTTKITLNIKYAPNSYQPDAPAMSTLDSLAEIMRAYPDTRITVYGFTDSQGAEDMNLDLSQKRAQGVADYLIAKGVAADRMTTVGHGEDPQYFVGDNATAEGRRLNRRVELETAK